MIESAEIIREKGTNRAKFFRGQIDKYTWVNYGSSYLPSDLNAAYLWAQLEEIKIIQKNRIDAWYRYYEGLRRLWEDGYIELGTIPKECTNNAHMFYIKVRNLDERTNLLHFLKEKEINAVFHYVPLHSAPAGHRYGRFHGEDKYTTKESERLIRLPLYYGITEKELDIVIDAIKKFYVL